MQSDSRAQEREVKAWEKESIQLVLPIYRIFKARQGISKG